MINGSSKSFIFQIESAFAYKKISLPPFERLILMAIAFYADEKGKCAISLDQIANFVRIARKNVSRYLKKLKELKILNIKHQYKKGTKYMNNSIYKINLSALLNLSLDEKGNPIIKEIYNVQIEDVLPMTTSYPPSDDVKNRNKEKEKTKEQKNIAHLHPVDNISKLPLSKFDEFWAIYPRKQDKQRAKKIWDRKGLDCEADKIIEDILLRASREVQWQNKEFIPHASTYLHGERWNDEILDSNNLIRGNDNAKVSAAKPGDIQSYTAQLRRAADNLTQRFVRANENNMGRKVD
jgi:hypothetical protein